METRIPIKDVRLAFCGASGSGKSTMAKYIAQTMGLKYTENSAGLLLTEAQQKYLVDKYGWTKSGHRDVIRLSNINPGFAWDFQEQLLKTRAEFIWNNSGFVIDRSPVDNLTYFLLQTAHLTSELNCDFFHSKVTDAMKPITHVIFLPTLNKDVEDNGSRISNWYYQMMVTAVFKHTITNYFTPNLSLDFAYLEYTTWDLETRKREIINWLLQTIDHPVLVPSYK